MALLFNYSGGEPLGVCRVGAGGRRANDDDTRSTLSSPPPYAGVENLEVMREAENYNRYLQSTLIARYAADATRVIDFGAGSGTFAVPCAATGFDVTAVEPDDRLRAIR